MHGVGDEMRGANVSTTMVRELRGVFRYLPAMTWQEMPLPFVSESEARAWRADDALNRRVMVLTTTSTTDAEELT